METEDRILKCQGCQAAFVFTGGEQEFFRSRGFDNLPTRCPACRDARKREKLVILKKAFEAICARCGRPTTVPFQPRSGSSVFCRDCFKEGPGR